MGAPFTSVTSATKKRLHASESWPFVVTFYSFCYLLGIFSPLYALFRYDAHAAALGRPVNFPLPGQGQALKGHLGAAKKRILKRCVAEKDQPPRKKTNMTVAALNAAGPAKISSSDTAKATISEVEHLVTSEIVP